MMFLYSVSLGCIGAYLADSNCQNSPNCPEAQRAIFGKLAIAQINKLAAATIDAGVS